jgi:hypothetical protein
MLKLVSALTAISLVMVVGWAEAKPVTDPGGGFVGYKPKKVGKDYYVVRHGQNGQCAIKSGNWETKPKDAVGDFPYASKRYAQAALKTFAECKGGLADDVADQ